MSSDEFSGLDPRLATTLRVALDQVRAEMSAELARLRRELGLTVPAPSPAATELETLLAATRALDAAPTQAALLGALLEAAGGFARRALFLVARDGALEGWAGWGFGTAAAGLAELRLAAPAGGLAACLGGAGAVDLAEEDSASLLGPLARPAPAQAIAVPFVLRGTVAGALYLDRAPGDPPLSVAAAQLLSYMAANALETLPLRGGLASPALRQAAATAVEPAPPATATPAVAPPLVAEPEAGVEAEAVEPTPPLAPIAPVEPEAKPAEAVSWQFETVAIDRRRDPTAVEPEAHRSLPAPAAAPGEEVTSEVKPPSDLVGPGWAFTNPGVAGREETRREEARRLARLLVTEIKLYNEEKVEESRGRGNIYAALRDEIDRSRRIFEERVAADLRSETDYFHDELVRILGGGDSATLGI